MGSDGLNEHCPCFRIHYRAARGEGIACAAGGGGDYDGVRAVVRQNDAVYGGYDVEQSRGAAPADYDIVDRV